MIAINTATRRYMSSPVQRVPPTASLEHTEQRLRDLGISSLAVAEGHALRGVISRTDLLRIGRRTASDRADRPLLELPNLPVSAVMNPDAISVGPFDPLSRAAEHMVKAEYHRVFVTDHERLLGVVSTRDVMRALSDQRITGEIGQVMSSPLFTVEASQTIDVATAQLERAGISGLVVVEDDWPVGVFTQLEALGARHASRETTVEEVMNPAFVCMPTTTPIHRAAAQAIALQVRRIIAVDRRQMRGMLTGIDFARCAR